MKKERLTGYLMGSIAYLLWGFLPLYWKLINCITPQEILAHRILWSLGFIFVILLLKKDWRWLSKLRNPRLWLLYTVSALLVSVNWFTYIWAVNNSHTVDASLGYFINPLFSVFLGVVFLHEKLAFPEVIAVLLALCGVIFLTIWFHSLPWVAIVLTITFGLYGLIKKQGFLDGIQSLGLETAIIFFPTLYYIIRLQITGQAGFLHHGIKTDLLLFAAGAITATPLLLFGQAARKIPLSTLGFLQYLAPTFQFLIGVLVFKEQFQLPRLIGFSIIWLALIIFTSSRLSSLKRETLPVK
ncbi:MAG: EamA family transporter RarD [Candidatus Cloacimonetes bacterium]|nr:EamA family transporter RarD [Candidatus Cloacimonadota bacterium]